eukprot:c27406_g2_i1 orf=871-3384(+)
MGVALPMSQPQGEGHSAHCSKVSPVESLLSSLHFARDILMPVAPIIPLFGHRELSCCLPESLSSSARDFVSHLSKLPTGAQDGRYENLIFKLSSRCTGANGKASASLFPNQVVADFFEGFLHSCLNQLPKHGTGAFLFLHDSSSDNRDARVFNVGTAVEKHVSGLSVEGLSNVLPIYNKNSKFECNGGKEHSHSNSTDWTQEAEESQKSICGTFIQVIVNHFFAVSSNVSKHACQWLPWRSEVHCFEDSKELVGLSEGQNFYIRFTTQEAQIDNSCHLEDHGHERKQIENCRSSASLGFARVRGDLNTVATASNKKDSEVESETVDQCEATQNSKSSTGLFKVPLSNIERLRLSLPAISLTELMELVPQIGKMPQDYPDKKKLFTVQDFFKYSETEGRRLFEELDRDNDGQITLEDLEVAMHKRRLPQHYAREFLRQTRKHWFAKSFGWNEFLSFMEQKEPMMLRAYNSLSLSKSGTLEQGQVLASLQSAGLPATEENAAAMMRCLDADMKGSITYGQFRNFMLLLPPKRLGDDPRMVWFEAATVVPMAPPLAVPAESVLKSALAGGLACALSTCVMHPIDTMKTRVQASSTLSFPELVSSLPKIGVKGLYRGSIPAIWGQFSSHGLRTGIFEASKLLLTTVAPNILDLHVQSLASFWSTVLGTAVRIPCEVLKQRLQAGIFDNVGDAIIGTWQQDGPRGFFRGTGATLCREVPFYVAGMGIYAEAKKAMQRFLDRELVPWETIAVGAISGGLAAVCTTPFDVMKTRTMTAVPGMPTRMSAIAFTIIREEGLLGLFKGAVPRFFWIAPLGAMNFAGYELAKRAMDSKENQMVDEMKL